MTTTPSASPLQFVPRAEVLRRGAPTLPTLCSTCHLRTLCLPSSLEDADLQKLDGLLFARRRVPAGAALHRTGDAFQFLYAVRSGTFKTQLVLRDGREQVTGFQFSGDLLGLDGLASSSHASTAVALEDSEVCAIPYAQLGELAAGSAPLRHSLTQTMSREIVREHALMMVLGSMNAEERMGSFLLQVSQHMKARGFSATEFHMRMSRAEIGSYLGLQLETVSRTLSAFQARGLLRVDRKHIRLLDLDAILREFEHPLH